jgi:starch synthase
MARILMVASEATPYATTGGLADVLGSLPREVAALGHEVAVLIPRYGKARLTPSQPVWENLTVRLGPSIYTVAIHRATGSRIPYFFLDYPPFYDRDQLYGNAKGDYPDNHLRFALLARVAFEVARYLFRTDIFHCHDWQAGLVPVFLRMTMATDPTFMGCRTLFTIHNLVYRGLFKPTVLKEIGLPERLNGPDALEFYGDISYLKGALVYSDALSTVSRTYAKEIQTPEYGAGLDGLLRARRSVLWGIVNGADYERWNPATDPHLAARYSADDLTGKQACKRALIREFGLAPENPEKAMSRPVLGIVSRFTGQKGCDLIVNIAHELFARDLYVVALGSGEARYEEAFRAMAAAHPDRMGLYVGYDDGLAHRIEAGADSFLMPSRYEPCGLNQIYSLRYGTPPVVRATGGLEDTIDAETGFKFKEFSASALMHAVEEASKAWADRKGWTARMKAGMSRDFSWKRSAREYSDLYDQLAAESNATIYEGV